MKRRKQDKSTAFWQKLIHDSLLNTLAWLLYLTLAEVTTVFVDVRAGVFLHLIGLFLILLYAAVKWERQPQRRFLLALCLAPLIRIVSLSLPLTAFPRSYWYLVSSLPTFAAAAIILRLVGMNWHQGRSSWSLSLKNWPIWLVQILIGLSGLLLGYVEYLILRPQPLVASFSWANLWLPAAILLVSTGYLEELVFRRIMQRTAIEHLGYRRGILYVTTVFALLHIGYQSLVDVVFVFLVGLTFGFLVEWTGSIAGVTLAHGLTNISLFLIMPFWAAGALPLPPWPEVGLPARSAVIKDTLFRVNPRHDLRRAQFQIRNCLADDRFCAGEVLYTALLSPQANATAECNLTEQAQVQQDYCHQLRLQMRSSRAPVVSSCTRTALGSSPCPISLKLEPP